MTSLDPKSNSETSDINEGSKNRNGTDAGAAAGHANESSNDQHLGSETTPRDNTGLNEESQMSYAASASLWCPINGRSHLTIVGEGMNTCPTCSQDLQSKPISNINTKPVSEAAQGEKDNPTAAPSTSSDVTETKGEDKVAGNTTLVSYYVAFRNDEDIWSGRVSWSRPFDLAPAPKPVLSKQSCVFDVTTFLNTTLPRNRYYPRSATEEVLKKSIIDDPDVDVSVKKSEITIHSQAILKTIAAVATYYPSVDLTRRSVTLSEPYTIIAHYLQELEDSQAAGNRDVDQNATPSAGTVANGPESYKTTKFEHLSLLLQFFEVTGIRMKIEEEKVRHAKGFCTFRMLWLLFKPGTTVYVQSGSRPCACVISALRIDPRILQAQQQFFSSHSFEL